MTDAQRLADAETQLHLLLTGQQARVFVDQNGEKVEFTGASAPRLSHYIAELRTRIAGRAPRRVLNLATSKGLI